MVRTSEAAGANSSPEVASPFAPLRSPDSPRPQPAKLESTTAPTSTKSRRLDVVLFLWGAVASETDEDNECAPESRHIAFSETADALAEAGAGHCRDLVNHQAGTSV